MGAVTKGAVAAGWVEPPRGVGFRMLLTRFCDERGIRYPDRAYVLRK